jgi:ABC-2 type transport system permease protein
MNLMHDIWLLFRRGFIQSLRTPVWLVLGITTPLLYLALFTPLLDNLPGGIGSPGMSAIDIFLPGVLALLAFGAGASQGYGTIFELQEGYIERLRVTPVSRFALLMGPILTNVVWLFVFIAVMVAAASFFGFEVKLAGLMVAFVLQALLLAVFAAFSVSVALVTRKIESLSAVVSGINLPIMLLSGVLLPLALAPEWMRVIAHANPMYYVVEASRKLAAGDIVNGTVGLAFLVMVPLTFLVVWWSTGIFRKAVS